MKYGVAAAQEMPRESGDFRKPDLVELVKLDSTIKLDIRYATSNNFLGRHVYKEARAFLQRPAADALMRANRKLREKGYGLLVFDGYRPWSVTKLFWDSTPQDKKRFVADPSQGSRHNRGCAIDLTLYDLRSGREVEMPSGYDEMTKRAYPNYSGGTEEQRRMREILREALESEGFTVYEFEWWHFDYKDWKQYPLLDIGFDQIKPVEAEGQRDRGTEGQRDGETSEYVFPLSLRLSVSPSLRLSVSPSLPLSPSLCRFPARPVKINPNASWRSAPLQILRFKWKTRKISNSITQSFAKTCASRHRII